MLVRWLFDLDADKATDLLESAIQSLRSFDVRMTASMRMLLHFEMANGRVRARKLREGEVGTVIKQYSRQLYQGGKGRIEILEAAGKGTKSVITYDGELAKSADKPAKQAFIQRPPVTTDVPGGDYRAFYRTGFDGVDLIRCLRERKGHVSIKEALDSRLLILDAAPVSGKSGDNIAWAGWGFRVALDPGHTMMPASIEILQPINGKLNLYRRMTVNEWKDLGNRIWVAIKATTNVFLLDPGSPVHGEIGNEITVEVDITESSWNKEIEDDYFRLPLPAGTKVIDSERRVQFVTGKTDPGENLDDLVKAARNVVPINIGSPADDGWSLWQVSLIVLALALMLLLAIWVRKRRSRRIL